MPHPHSMDAGQYTGPDFLALSDMSQMNGIWRMSQFAKADLIRAAQRASRRQERPLSRSDFECISGISQYHIYRLFPDGGWSELKGRAGIAKHPRHHRRLQDRELLNEFHLGGIGAWADPDLDAVQQPCSDLI